MSLSATITSRGQQHVTDACLRQFMRNWPGGVAVVTAMRGDRPVGCTVTAFISVSLDPPLVLVSLSQRSHTLTAITEQAAFGVNVLSWRHHRLAERFARPAYERFDGVLYRLRYGVPILDNAIAVLVCRLDQVIMAADHMLVLGRPQWFDIDDTQDPLIVYRGAYQTLGTHSDM